MGFDDEALNPIQRGFIPFPNQPERPWFDGVNLFSTLINVGISDYDTGYTVSDIEVSQGYHGGDLGMQIVVDVSYAHSVIPTDVSVKNLKTILLQNLEIAFGVILSPRQLVDSASEVSRKLTFRIILYPDDKEFNGEEFSIGSDVVWTTKE